MTAGRTDPAVRTAARGTAIAFVGAGFVFASWASRIPQVRDHLGLTPASLGLVLLAIAAGSVTTLPLSGALVKRIGSRATVQVMAALLGVGLLVISVGWYAGLPVLVVGLYVLGFANGAWDVAMNVQAAVVERRLGSSVMSRFHAGFSLGTVAGALVGAGVVAAGVPVPVHLSLVAVVAVTGVVVEARRFLADTAGTPAPDTVPAVGVGSAWREPRTVLVGLFVLCFAFTEGTGNDWISVAAVDGYDASAALGVLAFATFLAAMTVGRWFGPNVLDRHGRVVVLRTISALGVVGTALFVFGPSLATAFAGAVLWGLGASLGFPVGMSAAADDEHAAAARVSVVASIGYCAFLAGPPLIGFLGDHAGVLRALVAVAVLLGIATLLAGATREPGSTAAVGARSAE